MNRIRINRHKLYITLAVLIIGHIGHIYASVSTNVPLNHFAYADIEKLADYGFITSAMLTTRPITRLEMARLIEQAHYQFEAQNEKNPILLAVLKRLEDEFQAELEKLAIGSRHANYSYLKPLEDPYITFAYADQAVDIENNRGDTYAKDDNYRIGFASRMELFDTLAFYVHPEFAADNSDNNDEIDIIEGYGKIGVGKFELLIGKEQLWWGPGRNGSILLSNNTEPFKMIKFSNVLPIQLPWIFRYLGLVKGVWYLTELDEDRVIPEAKLTGMRVHFKPHPNIDWGLSRSIMFGGEGRPSLGARDYWDVFWARKENEGGRLDNNQLAGADASIRLPMGKTFPVQSIKLYYDGIGEDEAGGLPSNWGHLFGLKLNDLFRTGRTDITVEYADNHIPGETNVFYNHYLYKTGYTYKGRIIGHHMGTDAQDIFVRIDHALNENMILGFEYDRVETNLSGDVKPVAQRFETDLTWFTRDPWQIRTGYRYETIDDNNQILGKTDRSHLIYLQLTYDF